MKLFGIENKTSNNSKPLQATSVVFFILLGIVFSVFLFYHKISLFLFEKDKIDVFKEDLQQIAVYFLPIDRSVSHFLITIDRIIKSYIAGENVLITKEADIDWAWEYAQENKNYLKKLGFSGYERIINMIADLWKNKSEVFNLLGKEQPYNYLVILQNTNEKRPNGGFFGSFAFITMDKGHIKNLEIVDSYYPDFIAYRTRIEAPSRTSVFLPDPKIGFIAGNKFGFTDVDGKNLKQLYEKMFNETYEMRKVERTMAPDLYNKLLHKYIKGVIFIRSDTMEEIIPGFQEKIREWQFLNASVDLIRGEVRGNKKEEYTKEVKEYFSKYRTHIIKSIVNNFDKRTNQQAVNIRLSNVSTGLQQTIEEYNLINTFKAGYIYSWDTNSSFNKVDGFVAKHIQIKDKNGDIVKEVFGDVVEVKSLLPGEYNIEITYTLSVPPKYKEFIKNLEQKYDIEITDREKGILAVQSTIFEEPNGKKVNKWRESRSTMYLSPNIEIKKVEGDFFDQKKFTTPFANGLFYQIGTDTNNTKRVMKIAIEVK